MADDIHVDIELARRNVDRLGIDYSALPNLPFYTRLYGYTPTKYKLLIAQKIMANAAIVGRELTPPERDALAEHAARLYLVKAHDGPVASIFSIAFFARSHSTYGFPFYTPDPAKFKPSKFPFIPEGLYSQKAWHGLRFAAWYTFCKFSASVALLTYGVAIYMGNYGNDPRLREYRDAIAELRQRTGAVQPALQHNRQSIPGFENNTRQTEAPWAGSEQNSQNPQPTWPAAQSSQPEPAQTTFDDDPYIFDDASPVAQPEKQRANSQGSAWDRVRSQVRPGVGAQGENSAGPSSVWARKRANELTSRAAQQGTSFNFSSTDADNSYAKEQAQKEFDAMLERERKGQSDTRT